MSAYSELIEDLLRLAVESGASDVVIKAGKPGFVRLSGRLKPVEMDTLSEEEVRGFVEEVIPPSFRRNWEQDGQVDFSYVADDVGRFRVNAFRQRGQVSAVFRHIKNRVPTLEELNLQSEPLLRLAQGNDGIVLVCGSTGSGKSSTMAALLNWINRNQDRHIITIEDPIEYTFEDDKSVFQQREVGLDVPDFSQAVRSVLRQNPDVILIGEMRDRETFETAISAAETGHLVFSTLHAGSTSQALTRLFEFFPPEQQLQARRQIAGSMRGFICQKLIPALEGGGRLPANEVLHADATVRNLLLEGQFERIQGLLDSGNESGTFAFNRDLLRLVRAGKISKSDALRFSPNPQQLDMNLKGIFIKV